MGDSNFNWSSFPQMPTPRVFCSSCETNDSIYVIGGCDKQGTPLDAFESVNINSKTWTKLKPMPTKRAAPAVAAINNKIYAIGGVAVSQDPLDAVEMYDINTGEWTIMKSMSIPLLGLSCVVRDEKIWVIGGMSRDTNPHNLFVSFDVKTNEWKSHTPLPTPRYATYSFLIGDKLYVIGGRQGKLPCQAAEVFDFSTGNWTKLDDVPARRVFTSYVSTGSHIVSLGGLKEDVKQGFSNDCEVLDLSTGKWRIGNSMKTHRGDFVAGFLNGYVIAAGGLGMNGKPMIMSEKYDVATDTWEELPDMPSSHCSCTSVSRSKNTEFLVIGGLGIRGPTKSVEKLSIDAQKSK